MLGIITIASGDKRYLDMAKMLALSLKQTNPEIQRAVVSDAPESTFDGFFDIYIPYNADYGQGLSQKLHIDKYSSFEETLFIDSDCLVSGKLDDMIALCRKHSFVVFGGQISTGEWYMNVEAMCKKFDLPSVPLFNGGTYYFNDKNIAAKVYDKARELKENYDNLGFTRFRGSINEEPLIAIAMAMNNIEAVDDKGIGMRTPIGIKGVLKIDVLNKECAFNKEGEIVEPAIMHFAGDFALWFHYKREIRKLRLASRAPFINKHLVSFIINIGSNLPYATFIFFKRVVKTVTRGEKFDFADTLPVFPNN